MSGYEEGSWARVLVKERVDWGKGSVRKDEMSVEDLLDSEWDGCLAGSNSEKRRAHNLLKSGS